MGEEDLGTRGFKSFGLFNITFRLKHHDPNAQKAISEESKFTGEQTFEFYYA